MQVARIKLNLETITKENLKKKAVTIKKLRKNRIEVFYSGTSPRNTPKPMVFPKMIPLEENLVEGIGMYIGDGKFGSKDMVHSEFVTVEKDMALFFLNLLRKKFFVNIDDMSFTIRYRNGNKRILRNKWSKILKIPKKKFLFQERNKYNMKDSITIQVNSTIFTIIFRELMQKSLEFIKNDPILRKAFLRGFFAADGKLGIEKDTNTYYVSEITFCYNYKKEQWLRDYIIECLKMEGIENSNSTSGYIRVTCWENYLKFWNMKLFDLCIRKKNKFLKVVNQMLVYFDLNKNFLLQHLSSTKIPKNKLLETFNLHRTNFQRVLDGNQLLKLEQIEKLLNIFDIKWNSILNNTNRIRIGKQTYLNPQEDFINFVRNLRNMRGE
jgi:hypothetical protein